MTKTTIIQFTDAHVMPQGEHWHSPQADTSGRLGMVVSRINELNPDAVIMTGDSIDSAMITGDNADVRVKWGYDNLKVIMENMTVPVYFVPGNHDDREEMRAAFSDKGYMPAEGPIQYSVDVGGLRLIGLDTHVKGADHGELGEPSLDWLEGVLTHNTSQATAIFMHHPTKQIGQAILDNLTCRVSPRFEEMIRDNANIKAIVSGHYHQQVTASFGGKLFFVANSVAPAFEFALDGLNIKGLKLQCPMLHVISYDDTTDDFMIKSETVCENIIRWDNSRYEVNSDSAPVYESTPAYNSAPTYECDNTVERCMPLEHSI